MAALLDKALENQKARRKHVVCAWEECPQRDVLIEVTPFGARRPRYHDGCGNQKKRTGQDVQCANCGKTAYKTPTQMGDRENHFCDKRCHEMWSRHEQRRVMCLSCGEERAYSKGHFPRTADPQMMTWTCPSCRKKARILTHTYQCEQCRDSFTRLYRSSKDGLPRFCSHQHAMDWRRAHSTAFIPTVCAQCLREELQVVDPDYKEAYRKATFPMPRSRLGTPAQHRFCSQSHRCRYYRILHAERCKSCNVIIQHKGNGMYCSRECYSAQCIGQARPTSLTADAEQRIVAAWQVNVRGVRALARESGASVNTVRKLIAAGKLVEPAAAARSA